MRTLGKYRMRTPSTGREVVLEADPDKRYVDEETGEVLEVIAQLLPLPPSDSELPWALENLRFCTHCSQLQPKDLTVCGVCGGELDPLV
jgi:hypothetical protein